MSTISNMSIVLCAAITWSAAAGPDAPSDPCTSDCTLAPAPPSGASSDWSIAVHGNCLSNLNRLERWTGGTAKLPAGQSPQALFSCVDPGSLVPGAAPMTVVVLVHGWAPGYRDNVLANPALKWWDSDAASNSVWPSGWAWVPMQSSNPAVQATPNGAFQLLAAYDPTAVVLGYSWIDDSATGGSYNDNTYLEVYQSAAYTTINGIRLANALVEALDPSFWTNPANTLHLIGHSHGSKVATVAALALQRRSLPVAHLTILDSPETELTLSGNGANLLGFHLNELTIGPSPGGLFVDSHVSRFGVGYAGTRTLDQIVEVMLDPSKVFPDTDPGSQHSYAAIWYAGAAAAAKKFKLPPIGLAWPPAQSPDTPALNQLWPGGATNAAQWQLQAAAPIQSVDSFSTAPLKVYGEEQSGNVDFDDNAGVLKIDAARSGSVQTSWFEGGYYNPAYSNGYGVAFQFDWTNPADGDYVVVTVESPERGELGEQEVILVLDGRSLHGDLVDFPISWCADISGTFDTVKFVVYYVPASGNTQGHVTLREFRTIVVAGAG
ncbi:MAG: thioesterase domain-containing protein [Phycisphaerales bacterium]